MSYIAEQYMLDYERRGRLKDLVILRNLQDDMLMSPQLLFLGECRLPWQLDCSQGIYGALGTGLYCLRSQYMLYCCSGGWVWDVVCAHYTL